VEVTRFSEAAVGEFVELSRREYGDSPASDARQTHWKHLQSPWGASAYVRLVAGTSTVGRIMLQPAEIHTQSGSLRVACAQDALIAPEFRSPPTNFLELTKACTARAGFQAVFHTSNAKSEPLYRRLLKFPTPFSLKGYGFPLHFSRLTKEKFGFGPGLLDGSGRPFGWMAGKLAAGLARPSGLEVKEDLPDEQEFSMLVSRAASGSGPVMGRSLSFLRWRFLEAPLWPATFISFIKHGKFCGYAAVRSFELEGLRCFGLMDFMFEPLGLRESLAVRLWLLSRAARAGNDILFTLLNPGSPVGSSMAGFPFIPIPDQMLPHTTPIFMRAASEEALFLQGEGSLHLTLADLDYF
jgi:hypothetical protein